jgi:chaperonin GroES
MQTNYQPTGPNVLIKQIVPKDSTDGGIFIPETARKSTNEGLVMAVGRGTYSRTGVLCPPEVKRGDRVLWSKHQGQEFEKGFWIVREDDILGRYPETN